MSIISTNVAGRSQILSSVSSEDLLDPVILSRVINSSMAKHMINASQIKILMDYYKGLQPITSKVKEIRPEINNMIVVNHAQMATRDIVGYFLGTPIQYIQNGYSSTTKSELVDELNRNVKYEDKASVDRELGENQSICGTAYRIIYTDAESVDEVPFEDRSLDPETTFVVYKNDITEKPLLGVTYYDIYDENGTMSGTKYYVYTEFGQCEVISPSTKRTVSPEDVGNFTRYSIGGVPIIEYPNNTHRIGDWELVMDVMNTINNVQSSRMDDIEQTVKALLLFVNAEIDEESFSKLREQGVLQVNNQNGSNTDVKVITNTLDQSGISAYSQELEELLYSLIGIPSRNNRGGGGGDTGQAVELRDGWANLEIIARNKELLFTKSEKRALRIILSAFNIGRDNGDKLSLSDIDIKFSRNKANNMLVKTQSFSTLMATKTLSPADCLSIVDLVSDENEYMARGEAFWMENFADNSSTEKQRTNGSEDIDTIVTE